MLCIISAVSENGVIGRDGKLPWHLSADLKRFRKLTTGHTLIMGRKTYDSIGRPLPQRRSIVLSRRNGFHADGIEVVRTFEEALESAADDLRFVIGGAALYRLALPIADRLHLTIVHASIEGDVRFPDFDRSQWNVAEDERHEADENNPYPYSFQRYDRTLR